MKIAVQVEPATRDPAAVEYRWDADTDILTANLRNGAVGEGMSGSVELAGSDGSWLILDVRAGSINGVEVAVWPDVKKRGALEPPAKIEDARVVVPRRASQPGVAALQVETPLLAEADTAERTFHFRLGGQRAAKTVRIARDILLELDERNTISGVWLLNVPPFPAEEDAAPDA